MDYNIAIKELIQSWHDKAAGTLANYERQIDKCQHDIDTGKVHILRCGEFSFVSHGEHQKYLRSVSPEDKLCHTGRIGDVYFRHGVVNSHKRYGDPEGDSILIEEPPSVRYWLGRERDVRSL